MPGYDDEADAFEDGLRALASRHPAVRAAIEDNDGAFFIASLEAVPTGAGKGGAFMADLAALADRHGILLEVDPAEGALDALERFYGRYGFEWQGPERMERRPLEPLPSPGIG